MIDPTSTLFYIPPGLSAFKRNLFDRVAAHIRKLGGKVTENHKDLETTGLTPIVGCSPQLTKMIADWRVTRKQFIYWDRGYVRRVFATWLPRGENGGFYRWHVGSYQLSRLRDVADDRWRSLGVKMEPWRPPGRHIVIARPSTTYGDFHDLRFRDPRNGREITWLDYTVYKLSLLTTRQLVVRDKETKRDLRDDLDGAHCLVTHGSIAAVEAVIMGCPVFVDPTSAAALVGLTDLNKIEHPIRPDRTKWAVNLAYSQFDEKELVDGTLWSLMT